MVDSPPSWTIVKMPVDVCTRRWVLSTPSRPDERAPLWDPNEARYMLLARDILDRGRWLIPDLRGEPYLNKPQLFFWAVAVASLPGGEVTERTAALPAVLSSIATVAAVFAIGARTWGVGTGGMAALVLTSTIGFFAIGHYGSWAFRRSALARVESLWVLAYALPWTIFLVGAATWWRRRPDAERKLIATWTLASWLLVGLSGIHRARYLIPIYPGLALLVGEFLTRAAAHDGARALRRAFFAFAALAGVVAAIALSPAARLI